MLWRSSLVVALVSFAPLAQAAEGELVARPLGETDAPYGHLEYLPPGYAADDAKHPVLVVLHGIGEIGDGTTNLMGPMTANGPGRQIAQGSTWYGDAGMLVFIPQSTEWWDATDMHAFLGYIAASFRVDPRRLYITGLSMGGGGTWDYVAAHPGRASAAVPICGASSPGDGTPFVGTAVWAFHAWGDGTVPRADSVGWVDAIGDATAGVDVANVLTDYPNQNGDPLAPAELEMTALFDGSAFAWHDGVDTSGDSILRLTLYTDNAHDSWSRTYDDPAVLDWFAAQRKPPAIEGDDDIVIDNLDAEASFAGTWTRSEAVPGFWWWDYHEAAVAPDAVATFATDLPPAIYEVYVSWSAGADRATADVDIVGAIEAPPTMQIDMTQGGGFTSMGKFTFDAGPASVALRASAGASGLLVADAVGFVFRGELPAADTSGGSDGGGSTGADDGGVDTTGGDDEGSIDTGPEDDDSTGAPADDDASADGCGCSHERSSAGWALVVLALVRRRRR
jgi:MYXO-CTERM domain-containing protein